jgi:putative hemolysin
MASGTILRVRNCQRSDGRQEEEVEAQHGDHRSEELRPAQMPVHDFKELLSLGTLPGEERGSYLTLGGFIMMQIGRVPVTADSFDAAGLHFEVVDMDGKRVDKVLVRPLPASESEINETR